MVTQERHIVDSVRGGSIEVKDVIILGIVLKVEASGVLGIGCGK